MKRISYLFLLITMLFGSVKIYAKWSTPPIIVLSFLLRRIFLFSQSFDVLENYQNPFNNSALIAYYISSNSRVKITLYDLLVRMVRTLVNERKKNGTYSICFKIDNLTSGTYFAVLKTNSNTLTHKLLLIK